MEHGESECESKRNGQANMLLFSDLGGGGGGTDWVHGRPSSTSSYQLIISLHGDGKQSNIWRPFISYRWKLSAVFVIIVNVITLKNKP